MPSSHITPKSRHVPGIRVLVGLFALLGGLVGTLHADAADLPRLTLEFGTHRIEVEVAADEASRQRGLMHRTNLTENEGMLFVFPETGAHCMWMKNTPLPLAAAFIDQEGRIINVAEMIPHDLTPHCAQRPALYALEAKRGWFTRRGIGAGDRMHSPTPLPSSR